MVKRHSRLVLKTWFQLLKGKEAMLEDSADRLIETHKPAKVPYKLKASNYVQHRPRGLSYY